MKKNGITLKSKLLIMFSFLSALAFSQELDSSTKEKQNKNAIAIAFGSPGFNIEYARKLNRTFSLRLGYNTFSYENYEFETSIKEEDVKITAGITSQIFDFMFELNPFESSSFKIVLGGGYINKANLDAHIEYLEDVKYGELILTDNTVGDVDVNAKWSGVVPYVGLGFGRAVSRHTVGFGFEIGTYITEAPTVVTEATGLLSSTKQKEVDIQEALKTYKFIPKVNFRLSINF